MKNKGKYGVRVRRTIVSNRVSARERTSRREGGKGREGEREKERACE